ncbi:MAG: molybdenum cofactor guanylyltransferase MobA [Gammaproteobacteria bacterium]|jgi:molybdopterin-guanine dinucleotide biosynthesis protein A|nr:molybdenum cofactor guanylyltransferase MobA [Gammaproteobacteria bacterium]MCP4881295.1 molybdenum cofactor guanylyltransferase MobA [Gammaproteobacteria bacterium]MDP6165276.1 molybdenum cofactor guanylyltransferase MobA [Gammaproteobacteria bacterium]
MLDKDNLLGVILAGGQARRMGGADKPLAEIAGKPLLQYVIERAKPQMSNLLLNANGDEQRYKQFQLPIQQDIVPDFAGPLAGVLSAMAWARAFQPQVTHVITMAADTPFYPADYVDRMLSAIDKTQPLACASYQQRTQPVFGLWPVELHNDLHQALVEDGIHKVDLFTSRYGVADVQFDAMPYNPFFNVNRLDDVAAGEALLAAHVAYEAPIVV